MDRLIERIENIDYTHLLGYPSEVVAAEVITLVKEVSNEYINEVVEQLKTVEVLDNAIEIVKGGSV